MMRLARLRLEEAQLGDGSFYASRDETSME